MEEVTSTSLTSTIFLLSLLALILLSADTLLQGGIRTLQISQSQLSLTAGVRNCLQQASPRSWLTCVLCVDSSFHALLPIPPALKAVLGATPPGWSLLASRIDELQTDSSELQLEENWIIMG